MPEDVRVRMPAARGWCGEAHVPKLRRSVPQRRTPPFLTRDIVWKWLLFKKVWLRPRRRVVRR
jgi:hypothetical protein